MQRNIKVSPHKIMQLAEETVCRLRMQTSSEANGRCGRNSEMRGHLIFQILCRSQIFRKISMALWATQKYSTPLKRTAVRFPNSNIITSETSITRKNPDYTINGYHPESPVSQRIPQWIHFNYLLYFTIPKTIPPTFCNR